ncbi:MAG: glycosyltransferase family 2 protein, partial [Candidatus Promineifilaceae bacterium]
VQVKHLKRWTWWGWISADIFSRAVPWTQLLLERPEIAADLNLQWHQRASGVSATLLLPMLFWNPIRRWAGLPAVMLLCLNADFYRFLQRKRGTRFVVSALLLHWLYYVYSTVTFGVMLLASSVYS